MSGFELRVFDRRVDNPDLLVKFSEFIEVVTSVVPTLARRDLEIYRGAYGHGAAVCAIEDALEHKESVIVKSMQLLPVLLSGNEYFNNARIRSAEDDLEFGIHDSTFHYARGDQRVLGKISAAFKKVNIVETD